MRFEWRVRADAADETDAAIVAEVLEGAIRDERNNPDEPVSTTFRRLEDELELVAQNGDARYELELELVAAFRRRLANAFKRPRARRLVYLIAAAIVLAVVVRVETAGAATPCSVSVRADGRTFYGQVVRSVRTSCPFARNVTRASLRFIVRAGGVGDGDFYVWASSPVTHRWYRAHCWANGDLRSSSGMRVDCRAGIGARVIYHARES